VSTDRNRPETRASKDQGPPRKRSDSGRISDGAATLRERPRFHFTYLVLAVLGVFLLHDLWVNMSSVDRLPYSEFEQLLEGDRIAEVVVQGDVIRGTLKEPSEDGNTRFVTNRVDSSLAERLSERGVVFASRPQSTFLPTLLSWLIPIFLFFAVWLFLMRRMAEKMGGPGGGGLLSIGKSKAKVYVETDTKVGFTDVAGVDEAKAELQEVVDFLKAPDSYGRLGARMPKGILLVGPPGTGKTLLAKAVAGEAGVPFFSISGSEFVEMFVGVGAARVRDLFEQASVQAPCIIFVDELDALGKARNAQPGFGGHDEKEQTLNQLLVELDGFDPRSGIVLLAATNRPEILDPALLRAGRFDRQVLVDRPDRPGRRAILKVHLKGVQVAPGFDPEQVAALTPGFTGADLANLVNEAALVATRRRAEAVEMADFTAAIERLVAGLEKRNRLLNPREREIVAHHEMGHALVAAALPGTDSVQGLDHSARDRRARLHPAAPDRGPLPHDSGGDGGEARGPAGGPRGRVPDLRPLLDRRLGRSRARLRHRAQHGHPLRDGARARQCHLRRRELGFPRRSGLHRPAPAQRGDGARDRRGGPLDRGRLLRACSGNPEAQSSGARVQRIRSPVLGDPRRIRSRDLLREDRTRPPLR